jgi:hypothetical protein
LLFGQPLPDPFTLYVLELLQDGNVVGPPIALKGFEPFAWEMNVLEPLTLAAVRKPFAFCTGTNLAFGAAGMDVQSVRAATSTGVALKRAIAAVFLVEQMLAVWEGGSVVITRAAVQAADAKQVSFGHGLFSRCSHVQVVQQQDPSSYFP